MREFFVTFCNHAAKSVVGPHERFIVIPYYSVLFGVWVYCCAIAPILFFVVPRPNVLIRGVFGAGRVCTLCVFFDAIDYRLSRCLLREKLGGCIMGKLYDKKFFSFDVLTIPTKSIFNSGLRDSYPVFLYFFIFSYAPISFLVTVIAFLLIQSEFQCLIHLIHRPQSHTYLYCPYDL